MSEFRITPEIEKKVRQAHELLVSITPDKVPVPEPGCENWWTRQAEFYIFHTVNLLESARFQMEHAKLMGETCDTQ